MKYKIIIKVLFLFLLSKNCFSQKPDTLKYYDFWSPYLTVACCKQSIGTYTVMDRSNGALLISNTEKMDEKHIAVNYYMTKDTDYKKLVLRFNTYKEAHAVIDSVNYWHTLQIYYDSLNWIKGIWKPCLK